jgi:isoamylase
MLHQSLPLLCDSKIADSILLSVSHFSNNNNNNNSIGSSRVLDVGSEISLLYR